MRNEKKNFITFVSDDRGRWQPYVYIKYHFSSSVHLGGRSKNYNRMLSYFPIPSECYIPKFFPESLVTHPLRASFTQNFLPGIVEAA